MMMTYVVKDWRATCRRQPETDFSQTSEMCAMGFRGAGGVCVCVCVSISQRLGGKTAMGREAGGSF